MITPQKLQNIRKDVKPKSVTANFQNNCDSKIVAAEFSKV